jgi:hypothetical protein
LSRTCAFHRGVRLVSSSVFTRRGDCSTSKPLAVPLRGSDHCMSTCHSTSTLVAYARRCGHSTPTMSMSTMSMLTLASSTRCCGSSSSTPHVSCARACATALRRLSWLLHAAMFDLRRLCICQTPSTLVTSTRGCGRSPSTLSKSPHRSTATSLAASSCGCSRSPSTFSTSPRCFTSTLSWLLHLVVAALRRLCLRHLTALHLHLSRLVHEFVTALHQLFMRLSRDCTRPSWVEASTSSVASLSERETEQL